MKFYDNTFFHDIIVIGSSNLFQYKISLFDVFYLKIFICCVISHACHII